MRTGRLFSLRSPSGINLKEQCGQPSAFQKALNKLTVEYVTNEVGLLGIGCLLWPALRPFSKTFVRDGTFGVIFQSKEEEKQAFNEPRVLINAMTD
jgi:hypothetical protein